MNGNLESALVIELVESIKWGSALVPTAADGSLTVIDPDKAIDITKYSRRDRELAYRDLINATAVVKVSLHTESVWNSPAIRPKLQGVTGDDLPPTIGDLGASDSTVVHVKNSSLPMDAVATDKDLAGRDAMIYEVLAKACEVFEEPPITSQGSGRNGVTAWSLAEGVDYGVVPSPALPLGKDAFYKSDVSLAQRDNWIAAYASRIAEILKNPFAFATRLYVRIDGTDRRDAEIYALVRRYYSAGTSYSSGDEVFYQTKWYRALNSTTSVPTDASDWSEISSPRYQEWVAEPSLPFRNRIIYDTVANTLQWFRETTDTTHIPQLYAMSIPGLFAGQTITTVAQVPQRYDAQYWRQKADRIDYNGTEAVLASVYQDTTHIGSGVRMSDAIGMTAPSAFYLPLGSPVYTGHKYRLSALVKPVNNFDIDGNRNLLGVTGDGSGARFTGDYTPTSTAPGKELTFSLNVPAATWYISIEYTNLYGTTAGFGLRVKVDDDTIADDTVPLLFQDDSAEPLENSTPVRSQEWQFNSDGSAHVLGFIWSYGSGDFQINSVRIRTSDRFEAEYFIKAEIHDSDGNDIYFGSAPTIESTGRKNVREILAWDFTAIEDSANPYANITWMSSSDLPIKFTKISFSELSPTFATAGVAGFESFKGECLSRAERSVQTAFSASIRNTSGTISDFTADGTEWNDVSTDNWMSLIETREPRLRQLDGVTSVRDGFQYQVSGDGYAVYNFGTYSDFEVFNGTSVASDFIAYGATVINQVGAFRKSTPTDLGQPVLMPLGLYYDERNDLIRMASEPSGQIPTVVACQPWMVEAGLYAADDDFRAGETTASAPDTVTISTLTEPLTGGSTVGDGRYSIFSDVTVTATPASIDWSFAGWYDVNGNILSASAVYVFSAVETTTLTARFEQI